MSPSVWAWRRERLQSIGRSVDRMLALFPFEPPLYEAAGIAVTYVGHPLAHEAAGPATRRAAREVLQHKPATLKIATCLDKPSRRLVPIEADYVAFSIPNRFVIGYGMDYAEVYRNVPDIRLFPNDAGH